MKWSIGKRKGRNEKNKNKKWNEMKRRTTNLIIVKSKTRQPDNWFNENRHQKKIKYKWKIIIKTIRNKKN